MNEPTNAPMLPPPSGVSEWVSVWRDALTRPSDQTYARIAQSPNAKTTTALLWIFVGSLISSLLAIPAQGAAMRQMIQTLGLEGQGIPTDGGGLAGCGDERAGRGCAVVRQEGLGRATLTTPTIRRVPKTPWTQLRS